MNDVHFIVSVVNIQLRIKRSAFISSFQSGQSVLLKALLEGMFYKPKIFRDSINAFPP